MIILTIILGVVIGFLCGVAVCAVFARRLYNKYLRMAFKATTSKPPFQEATPSNGTRAFLRQHPKPPPQQNDTLPTEQIQCINFLADFLFIHLRDTAKVKKMILSVVDRNLEFLLTKTSIKQLCKRLKVKNLDTGTQMPHFNNIRAVRPKQMPLGEGYELELEADMDYEGKANIEVEADLIFGKTAKILITLAKLEGRTRFAFYQHPHLYWTFGIVEDATPKLNFNFEVEVVFEGRSFQTLTTLVKNQINAAFRRTAVIKPPESDTSEPRPLKKRYAPFFSRPLTPELIPAQLLLGEKSLYQGTMTVEVIGCRQLKRSRPKYPIYATLALFADEAPDPQFDDSQEGDRTQTLRVELVKAGSGSSIGISLKDGVATIQAVKPGSPASGVGLQVGDRIISVDDIPVIKTKKALQLIKKCGYEFVLEVQRESKQEQSPAKRIASRTLKGRYAKTSASPPSRNPDFRDMFTLQVAPATPKMYIRVYDIKNSKKKGKSRRYLCGYGEVDLESTTLFCVANASKLALRVPLHNSDSLSAGRCGYIKLIIEHHPASKEVPIDEIPFSVRKSTRPRVNSVVEDDAPTKQHVQKKSGSNNTPVPDGDFDIITANEYDELVNDEQHRRQGIPRSLSEGFDLVPDIEVMQNLHSQTSQGTDDANANSNSDDSDSDDDEHWFNPGVRRSKVPSHGSYDDYDKRGGIIDNDDDDGVHDEDDDDDDDDDDDMVSVNSDEVLLDLDDAQPPDNSHSRIPEEDTKAKSSPQVVAPFSLSGFGNGSVIFGGDGKKSGGGFFSSKKKKANTSGIFSYDLYPDLEPHVRRKKLEEMMGTIEEMLVLEGDTRKSLEAEMREKDISAAKFERLKANLVESDRRRDELHHQAFTYATAVLACEDELGRLAETHPSRQASSTSTHH